MDRSATYGFLLMFHNNHGRISYGFQDKWRFQLKIANFPTPVYFPPHWWDSPCIGYWRWGQKTRMMGLPGRERSLTMSLAVWIQ